jgi:hypothetical protein
MMLAVLISPNTSPQNRKDNNTMPISRCLLHVGWCLLPAACCLLPIACCLLPIACCR